MHIAPEHLLTYFSFPSLFLSASSFHQSPQKAQEYERDWIDQLGESIPSLLGKISEIKILGR